MAVLPVVILVALAGSFAALMFMAARNQWVFRQRMAFHAEAFDRPAAQWLALGRPSADDLCVSYETMLWRFWVWDREKFRKRRLPSPCDSGSDRQAETVQLAPGEASQSGDSAAGASPETSHG